MIKKTLLLCLLWPLWLTAAPVLLPASGQKAHLSVGRDQEVSYHNHQVDNYLCNAQPNDRWAVYFDFQSFFADDSVTFTPSRATVWLQGGASASVSLCSSNQYNEPGSVLKNVTLTQTQYGWNTFDLSGAASYTGVWLVLDYDTTGSDTTDTTARWVGASSGSGAHSWYYVQAGHGVSESHWANMEEQNMATELLVSLFGTANYIALSTDLELTSFSAQVVTEGSNRKVRPALSIRNNSSFAVSNPSLVLQVESPCPLYGSQGVLADTLSVATSIAPGQIYTLDADTADRLAVNMPDVTGELTATVTVQGNWIDTQDNHTSTIMLSSFEQPRPTLLVENFLQANSGYSDNVLAMQAALPDTIRQNTLFLDYYPVTGDAPWYNSDATHQFNRRQLSGCPSTVADIGSTLTGLQATRADSLLTRLHWSNTFLTLENPVCRVSGDSLYTFTATVRNPDSWLFSWHAGADSLLFYGAVVLPDTVNAQLRYKFLGFIGNNGLAVTANHGQSTVLEQQFDLASFDLPPNATVNNLMVLYWVELASQYEATSNLTMPGFAAACGLCPFTLVPAPSPVVTLTTLSPALETNVAYKKITANITVKNTGTEGVFPKVKLELINPVGTVVQDAVIGDSLAAGATGTVSYTQGFTVRPSSTQYVLRAFAMTQDEDLDDSSASGAAVLINTFNYGQNAHLAENFLYSGTAAAEDIWLTQMENMAQEKDSLWVVNWYPGGTDPLFSGTALERCLQIGTTSLPFTLIEGNTELAYDAETYATLWQQVVADIGRDSTFVNNYRVTTGVAAGNYQFELTLKNQNTNLFDWYGQGLTLYTALYEDSQGLNRMLGYATAPQALPLTSGQQLSVSFSFKPEDFYPDTNCMHLVWWLESSPGEQTSYGYPFTYNREIWAAGSLFLPEFRDNPVNPLPLCMACYPNPSRGPININIGGGRGVTDLRVNVYDVRGRKVRSLHAQGPAVSFNALDEQGRRLPTGIYLVRAQVGQNGKKQDICRKILLLK